MTRRTCALAIAVGMATGSTASAASLKGKVEAPGMRSNANAVVYVEKIDGSEFPAPKEPVVMDQKGKEFVPKVLPVLVGATVNFVNSDPIAHNVFTPDGCAEKFNLGTWPTGEARPYTFKRPCEAVILCNIHPEMSAYVVAVETPFFAVTDAEGRFTIPNLPDGTYTVSVWHERFKKQSQTVKVANGTGTVDFTLKR